MKKYIYLTFLSLAGVALLLFKIGNHNLWIDEAYSLWQSSKSFKDLLITIFQQDPHPPLYYILMKLWCSFFGFSINSGLYFSITFSLLAVCAGIYLNWLMFGGHKSVYIMLIIIITSPFYIMFSRMIRYYSLVSFLVLVCLIFFIKYLNSDKKVWWFFLLLAHIFVIYADYPASTIFLGELCSVLFFRKYRTKIVGLSLNFLITAVAFNPWAANLFFNINNLSMSSNKALLSGSVLGLLLRFFFSVYDFFVGECIYPWKFYVTLPLLLAFIYIIKNLVTSKKRLFAGKSAALIVFMTVSISFMSVILMSNYFLVKQSFVYTPSRLMFCFIPFMIIISYGVSRIGGKSYYVLGIIVICNSLALSSYYKQQGFINPVYIVNWNKAIDELKDELKGDEILISDESEVLRYYVKNKLPDSLFFYDENDLKNYLESNIDKSDRIKLVIFKTQRDSTDSGMFSKQFIEQITSQVLSYKEYTPVSDVYVKLKESFGAKGYKYKMKVITALIDKKFTEDFLASADYKVTNPSNYQHTTF